jgi:hypothetical protein
VLGRLLDDRPISVADLATARQALPAFVMPSAHRPAEEASERLARINETWEAEASWGGVSFRSVPLTDLP